MVENDCLESPSNSNYLKHMRAALQSAKEGCLTKKEGWPFGAAIVKSGRNIAVVHNTVLLDMDPTAHAEMNCIRVASKILQTNDLSLCDLHTTSEPCPMCWGAIQNAKIKKVYVGAHIDIAAKYGFDDAKYYGDIKNIGKIINSQNECVCDTQKTLKYVEKILPLSDSKNFLDKCFALKWKMHAGNNYLGNVFKKNFDPCEEVSNICDESHVKIIQGVIRQILNNYEKVKSSEIFNKHLSPYGAIIMKNGKIIAECYENDDDMDPTATVAITVIKKACKKLQTRLLDGCCMYTTASQDIMGIVGAMWAQIDYIYTGIGTQFAASYGYVNGFLQFKELECSEETRVTETIFCNMDKEVEEMFKEWKNDPNNKVC